MSAFGGLIFTNKGRNLQAKAQVGSALNFTRIAVGDGNLGGSSIADLNALKNQVKSLGISRLKTLSNGKAVVGTVLSNQELVSGFYFRELGVFAQDPDLGEVLYCYGNAGANAEYVPAGGGPDVIEKNINVITIVGNASNITAIIDESLIFATANDLTALQTDFNNHINGVDPHQQYALDSDLNNLAGAGRTNQTVKGNADALTSHLAENAAHGATSAATANKIMVRDANGRAKVAAPSASDDIARKDTVDNHANLATTAHGGVVPSSDVVAVAAANKILKLDGNAKLPASITGDAATLDGKAASVFLQNNIKNTITRNTPATPTVAPIGTLYNNGHMELLTLDQSFPALGFHRAGQSAVALYHKGGVSANEYLRFITSGGEDGRMWHEGNLRVSGGKLQFYDGGVWKDVTAAMGLLHGEFSTSSLAWTTALEINGAGVLDLLRVSYLFGASLSFSNIIRATVDGKLLNSSFGTTNSTGTASYCPSSNMFGTSELFMAVSPPNNIVNAPLYFKSDLKIEIRVPAGATGTVTAGWQGGVY